MIRYVDLFAGVGGIRLGFKQALDALDIASKCVLSSEIDGAAAETYSLNFGEHPSGDINRIQNYPKFDFLLAGFPCQPFSFAGKQKGFGDTRGTLFFEIERLLKAHRPQGFLLENVRGLVSHDGGRTLQTILNSLSTIGYKTQCLLLNSSEFDVPQNRVRLYIVGLRDSEPKLSISSDKGASDSHAFKKKNFESQRLLVKDILEENVSSVYDCSPEFKDRLQKVLAEKDIHPHGVRMIDFRNGNSVHSWELAIKGECSKSEIDFMNALVANRRKKKFGVHQDGKSLSIEQIETFFHAPNLTEIITSLLRKGYLKEREGKYNLVAGNMSFEIFKILDPNSISITLVASDAHKLGIFDNGRLRHVTPRECARLQGFPDSFKLNPVDGHAYRQFGNSVSVPVVEAVITDLFENNPLALNSHDQLKIKRSKKSKTVSDSSVPEPV